MEIGTRGYCLMFVLLSGCCLSSSVGTGLVRKTWSRPSRGHPSIYRGIKKLFVCRTRLSRSEKTIAASRVPQHIISTLTCPRSASAHFGHSRPSFRLLSRQTSQDSFLSALVPGPGSHLCSPRGLIGRRRSSYLTLAPAVAPSPQGGTSTHVLRS